MPVYKSTEIHCREDFPLLLNWRRLYGYVIEIGVDKGEFSAMFLSRWYGNHFYGVDNYVAYPAMIGGREPDLYVASIKYERYSGRARLLRGDIAHVIPALSRDLGAPFDFAYIDGGHSYSDVASDTALLWPMISERGILAWHDYDHTHPDVMLAVNEFSRNNHVDVYLTHEKVTPSAYAYKSGKPGPEWERIPKDELLV